MFHLTESQSLLFKACFLSNGEAIFKQWTKSYGKDDLDFYTRAIIPSLLNALNVTNVDPDLAGRMLYYKRHTWLSNSQKFYQLKPILENFAQENIACCFLKGAAMMFFYYQDVSQRPTHADIDFFMSLADIKKAIPILKKHGFSPQACHYWEGDALEQQVLLSGSVINGLHAIHYQKGDINIDLHWRLSPFTENKEYADFQSNMLTNTTRFKHPFHYFTAEMLMSHIAIHSAFNKPNSPSLNNMIDFCFLVNSTIDYNRLLKLDLYSQNFIAYTIIKCREYINTDRYIEIETHFLKKLKKKHRVLLSLLFSRSRFQKRLAQVYCFLRINHCNPLLFINNLTHYFGIKNKAQLLYLLKKKFILRT